jgi:protein-glutamine gamma-glutamyltransferase
LNFERTFVLVSYGLVGVAFLAVAMSGEIGWVAPAIFGVCWVVSLPMATDGPPKITASRIWTGFLFVAAAALIGWAWYDGRYVHHALEFALLMTISRLFQRRFAKDYLQLYALSFLLMLVAAVIHPSLTFAVCFLIYTVLSIWALTILHLVREIEVQTATGPEHLLPPEEQVTWWLPWNWRRKPPEPVDDGLPESPVSPETLRWRRRKLIGGKFLVASSLMALSVLGVSMVFFFLFPRLGMGFFLAQTRGSQAVVGFSDSVKLGGFGNLKTSAQVVARVTYPDEPERIEEPLRVRGVSFDAYNNKTHTWERRDDAQWILLHHGDRYAIPRTPGPQAGYEKTYTARIYLEPLSATNKVLFAPPRPLWIEFADSQYDTLRGRRKRVTQSLGGDLGYRAPDDAAIVYVVSAVEKIDRSKRRELLANAEGKLPRWVRDRWTELPPGLDTRIEALADTLTKNDTTLWTQAHGIERALQAKWEYSTEGGHNPKAPLVDFLFGIKTGHCEYFATAMTLMMRHKGHAARVVNGFVGGELNTFGGYRMIRQGDAHSWVEVYFPGLGWQTFDPTPPSGQLAPFADGIIANVRRLVDGAAMVWYTWVVEYDLERQVGVFRSIGRQLRKLGSGLKLKRSTSGGGGSAQKQPKPKDTPIGRWLLGALPWLFGITGLFALTFFLMRRGTSPDPDAVDRRLTKALHNLERQLRKRDMHRRNWETWSVVAARVAQQHPEAGEPLRKLGIAYDQARYSASVDELKVQRAIASAVAAEAVIRAIQTEAPDKDAA